MLAQDCIQVRWYPVNCVTKPEIGLAYGLDFRNGSPDIPSFPQETG